MNNEDKENDVIIIACYPDGSIDMKTSFTDVEDVVDVLYSMAEELEDSGLDTFTETKH